MTASGEWIGAVDRPHVPTDAAARRAGFKEWWHFNLIDDQSGLDLLINLNVEGDIYAPGAGQASLIILAHTIDQGWRAGIDLFDGIAAQLGSDGVNIVLGPSRIRYDGNVYRLDLVSMDGTFGAELVFEAKAEPLLVHKDTPLGTGHINWVIMPNFGVRGSFRVGGREIMLASARGYHDHNWGRWKWGDDFGWEWAFCAAGSEEGAFSLVYDRTTNRGINRVLEHSLGLWQGKRLVRLFSRRMLTSKRLGRFTGDVRRVPGAMALVAPWKVTSIPAAITISANDGPDWLEARYEPDAAIQIAIPCEATRGLVEVNETMGWLSVEGVIGNIAANFRRRACFEFVA